MKGEKMKKTLWAISIVAFAFLGCGPSTASQKQEAGPTKSGSIRWVSVGTLVSVGPDTESTPHPGRLKSAILGETQMSRTRVETTEGVYTIRDKIGIVEMGSPVSVGYDSDDKYPDTPSLLAIGDDQYEIVR
jgi:hypothetical protein